jgi:hypothetical protein
MKHAEKESQGVRFYNEFWCVSIDAKWWPVNCEAENFRGHKGNLKIKMEYSDIVERLFYVDTGKVRDSGWLRDDCKFGRSCSIRSISKV